MAEALRLRVLEVSARFLPQVGGVERHMFEVASRLPTYGIDVEVLTTDATGELPRRETIEGISVTRIRAWPSGRDYYLAPGIVSAIRAGAWDIVHVQGVHTLVAPLAMAAARHNRIPYVVTFHSGGHSSAMRARFRHLQWLALRPWLRGASRLIAVSGFERDLFAATLGLASQRIAVIPNGSEMRVDTTLVSTAPVDHNLVIAVGRVEHYKGHWRLVEAMPTLLKRRPAAQLRIVGDGPDRAPLLERARALGVADHVEIAPIGTADRAAMYELLSRAGAVALMSDYEAHPVSVMEALALGKPVVVADTTGLSEIAAHGWATAIPLRSSGPAIATALLEALDSPPHGPVPLPSWDDAARQLAALYREASIRPHLNGPRPQQATPSGSGD